MSLYRRFLLPLLLTGWSLTVWAGGGPLQVLVIVNDNSPDSLDVGQYYQDLRGLPERNIVHVQTTTNVTTTVAAFSNEVVVPVRNYLASAGLSNQIDGLILTRGLPYRVGEGLSSNGSSAVLFYGFHTNNNPFTTGCVLLPGTPSDYFAAETAFTHGGAPSSNRYYLSTILTGKTQDETMRALDRARAADGAAPTGRVALLHATNLGDVNYSARTVRWTEFDDALFTARFHTNGVSWAAVDSDGLSNSSNLVGYLLGLKSNVLTHTLGFVPGALADHLTSYGGCLFDPLDNQMSILEWLAHGAAGSYGTVSEPCAFLEKFPQARLHYWYGRGFNLAESYTMSVQHPFQGVIVGDPLTAPYACPPLVTVSGLVAGLVVTSDVPLTLHASTTGEAGRVSRLDVFVDGYFAGTATNLPPAAGNSVSVTLDTNVVSCTVQSGDTLERVAARLAQAITNDVSGFRATAYGDRVEIVQQTLGLSGAWIQVSADAVPGTATYASVFARSVFTNFMESTAEAREVLVLVGTPVTDDEIRAVVTRLDGVVITNRAFAIAEDTHITLMSRLLVNILNDTNLQSSVGCRAAWHTVLPLTPSVTYSEASLVARTNGWPGAGLFVDYLIKKKPGSTLDKSYEFSDNFNDNAEALGARANIFLTEGTTHLAGAWTLAVTNLPDGPHEVEVVACEGSAVRVQGRLRIPFVVDRHTLTCAITNPVTGRHVLRGTNLTSDVAVASPGSVTQVEFWVEGKMYATTSAPPYAFTWSTTNCGAGAVGLQALARDDGGRAALSEVVTVQLYTDVDTDGLSDQWEYRTLGSRTNGAAADDPDSDGANNQAEFLADTDPRSALSRPEVDAMELADGIALTIPITNTRLWAVEFSDDLTASGAWNVSTNPVAITNGPVLWSDPATHGLLFYRVRASLP